MSEEASDPPSTQPPDQTQGQMQGQMQDQTQAQQLTILLPEGATKDDFPNMNLDARQQDQTKAGGSDHEAPPVPNDPDNMLLVQFDEDGNIIFVEIANLTNTPLGMWVWSESSEEWVFIDIETPLGYLPQTGLSDISGWLMLAAISAISAGIVLNWAPPKTRTPRAMAKFALRRK